MTKKSTERIYLNRFLDAMGWPYELEDDGEAPDFIINVAGRRVGVEIVQVFADQDADYSEKREDESNRLTWLRKLCREYYEAGGPSISLLLQVDPGASSDSRAGFHLTFGSASSTDCSQGHQG